ncbi:MAG: radical SAM protein [Bacteroidales bacterium]
MTRLRQRIAFGPIKSRRLGNSLGINLLPINGKVCTFDCIYCECGWNKNGTKNHTFPKLSEVKEEMKAYFVNLNEKNIPVDTITFSGNGEPTLHPEFPQIIDYTLEMRDKYFPKAVVSVLSNSTTLDNKEIRNALRKIDNPILKLDSGDQDFLNLMNNPQKEFSLEKLIHNLSLFEGNFILQTMFLKGKYKGKYIDSADPILTKKWIDIVLKLHPKLVQVYTIARDTPAKELEKISEEKMYQITEPLRTHGIKVQIAG